MVRGRWALDTLNGSAYFTPENAPTRWRKVRESNAPALGLYKRFGFSEVGHRRGYYDHPKEDARILMAKI